MRMMLIALLTGFVLCSNVFGGTLIYKNKAGETKWVSGLTILSIDEKKMVVRINNGTETIWLSQVSKYYNSDIRMGGEFDDGSAEYTIWLGQEKITSSEKTKGQMEFSIPYDVNKTDKARSGESLRAPYMYLFVLVSDAESLQRKMYSFSFPGPAKVAMKTYDEAKMLEKAIALNRPRYHYEDASLLGSRSISGSRLGGDKVARFPLSNLRNGTIIAWYLVAWGKSSIVATKEWRKTGVRIEKTWWLR